MDDTRPERYNWPMQGNPGVKDWDLWREALQAALCSRQRVLQRRLGRWFAIAPTRWYYDERSERLYNVDDRILMYPKVSGHASRSASRRFRDPIQVYVYPESAVKATVERVRSTITVTGWAESIDRPSPVSHTLREYIEHSVPKYARWAIERFVSEDDGATLADSIKRGFCIGVSDGSFKDKFGTACWILKAEDQESGDIRCPCVVPGGDESHSAYRSELAGLYGMATMVWTICEFYQVKDGVVELACDGLQALRHVATLHKMTEPKMPQFDLLAATRRMLQLCPVTFKFRHVKGHQDDDPDGLLDEWAILNIAMDDGAKEQWYQSHTQRGQEPYIFGKPWPLWVAGRKIAKEVAMSITDHIKGNAIRTYWQVKSKFGESEGYKVH